jgi:phage recombination protein Bet
MSKNNGTTDKELLPVPSTGTAVDFSSAETVQVLKQTVAKGATDAEFEMFKQMCQSTGLNPFRREIWFIKTNSQVQMMTGVNGFYQIANSHPQYDGMESEVIEEDGKIIKAVAKVYRKDRSRPQTATAYFAEYNKSYGNWKTMPRMMLEKCAESMALRKAFPQQLNGLYTQDEMPQEYAAPPRDADAEAHMRAIASEAGTHTRQIASEATASPKSAPKRKTKAKHKAKVEKAPQEAPAAPETPPETPQVRYEYYLGGAPLEKLVPMSEYLMQNGASQDEEDEMLWSSPMELPRLKNYLVED